MYKHCGFLLLMLATASAHAADDRGVFVGIGAGEANIESGGFDESDTAFKLFGGYSFNKYLAAEFSYIDGGTPHTDDGTTRLEVESTGWVLSALGRLPLGERFALFGRFGWAFYESTATLRAPGGVLIEVDNDDDLFYGIGAAAQITEAFGVRLEWEALDVSDGSYDILSLSAVVRF